MRSRLAMAAGVAYVLLGVSVAVAPGWFMSFDWGSRQGLYTAAAIRIVAGLVLLLAASTSRFPTVFRVIGVLALVAGMVLPFVPLEFWGHMMNWWIVGHPTLFRALMAIGATAGGAFITWAATPKRTAA
jgi:hypothetical protein